MILTHNAKGEKNFIISLKHLIAKVTSGFGVEGSRPIAGAADSPL